MYPHLALCYNPFAGTPKGVGPVRVGQKIEAGITGLLDIQFDVGRRNRA